MMRRLLFVILIAGVPSLSFASIGDGRLPSCHSYIWAVWTSVKNTKNLEIIDSWKPRLKQAWESKHNKKWEDNDWGILEFTGDKGAVPAGKENKLMQKNFKKCLATFKGAVNEIK